MRREADVFLLTAQKPALLPVPGDGLALTHDDRATTLLLDDLRADACTAWVPTSAWLTKLSIDSDAADTRYDLAVDASGEDYPSARAAGLNLAGTAGSDNSSLVWLAIVASLVGLIVLVKQLPRRGVERA